MKIYDGKKNQRISIESEEKKKDTFLDSSDDRILTQGPNSTVVHGDSWPLIESF